MFNAEILLAEKTHMPGRKASSDPHAENHPYQLQFFMEKHGLSEHAAKVILRTNGPSRHRCDHAAKAYLQALLLREARLKPPAPSIRA